MTPASWGESEEAAPDVFPLLRGISMGWGGLSPFIAKAPRVSAALSPLQPPPPLLLLIQTPQDPIASKRNRGFRPSATALSIPPAARPRGHLPSHVSAGNFKPRTLSELALLLGWTSSSPWRQGPLPRWGKLISGRGQSSWASR